MTEVENDLQSLHVITKQPLPAAFEGAVAAEPASPTKHAPFLCYSPKRARRGQVDLFPRSWCCFGHGIDDEDAANNYNNNKSTFYEGNEDFKPGSGSVLGSLAWKVCFYLSCFPMCYACYITRSIRQRKRRFANATAYVEGVLFREDGAPKKCEDADGGSGGTNELLNSSGDQMNHTLFRQVSEPKARKRARRVKREGNARDSKHSILAESDDRGGADDVIDVNVVILHSKSSRALHKHLTSSASSASCSTSREDVSAKESDNKSFLQAKSGDFLEVPAPSSGRSMTTPRPLSSRLLQRPSSNASSSSPSRSRRAAAASLPMVSEGDEADDGGDAAAAVITIAEDNEEVQEDDEFQDCLTVIQVESSTIVNIPTILTTAPSTDTSAAPPATSWRRLRGVLSATSPAKENEAEKQGLCPRDESEAETGAVRKRASSAGIKGRWKSIRSKTHRDRYNISDDIQEDGEDEVLLRRVNAGVGGRKKKLHKKQPSLQRKNTMFGSRPRVERRLTSSTARGSSRMFYSFDEATSESDDDEDADEVVTVRGGRRRRRQNRQRVGDDKVTRMRSLGNWTELVGDLGYQLTFSYFDEASVSEWRGCDLRLACDLPNIDLIVLPVRKNDVADLNTVMNTSAGMMSYFAKFWRGFYPLLIVELMDRTDSIEDSKPTEENPDFAEAMGRLHEFFGDVHHIQVFEAELAEEAEWITECMARLFIHSRLFQCSRFYGDGLSALDKCPGGCELNKRRRKTRRLVRGRGAGRWRRGRGSGRTAGTGSGKTTEGGGSRRRSKETGNNAAGEGD